MVREHIARDAPLQRRGDAVEGDAVVRQAVSEWIGDRLVAQVGGVQAGIVVVACDRGGAEMCAEDRDD